MKVTRALAASTALVVAALGTSSVVAGAAAADPGHGNGQAHGQSHAGSNGKDQANGNGKGQANGQGKPAKAGNGNGNGNGKPANPGNGNGNGNGQPANPGNGNGNGHGKPANPGNGNRNGHGKPANPGNGNGNGHGKPANPGGGHGTNGGDHNPPGNNGTIKVDAAPFDDAPNNEPHVGCTFQIDFYGFDEGDLYADVIFEAHPPTTSPSGDNTLLTDTVFIGEDDASGGGSEAGLDASKTYTLDFGDITPHPKQGYHVKLTIHADGSQGADTKHKVFWVEPCGTPDEGGTTPGDDTTPGGDEEATPPGDDTTVEGEQATTTGDDTEVAGVQESTNDTQVAGQQASAGNLPTEVDSGGNAFDWVLSPIPLLVIGLGVGVLVIGIATRRRQA